MTDLSLLTSDIADLEKTLAEIKQKAGAIQRQIKARDKAIEETAGVLREKAGALVDTDQLLAFFKRPYVVIPQSKNKVLVAVPKFVRDFQAGWLWKETDSFFIYQFDQYSAWLGDAPVELLNEIGFEKGLQGLTVSGNRLEFPRELRDEVRKKLGDHISRGTITDTAATIAKGHVFDVIVETIKAGNLPFTARPVDKQDLRPASGRIALRKYQQPVVDRFLATGAVGAFHPTGAGKSFIAMYLMDVVKGPKALFVPNNTLKEQWYAYIEQNIPDARREVSIFTYQTPTAQFADKQFALVIYDECQYLPADTFSRLALINTKYRIGLSASPHREDGREAYIFALTGFPCGLNWQAYMEEAKRSYHPINVHVVRSATAKLAKIGELLDPKKRTFIFSDSIDFGKQIASRFSVPFVHGETTDRMRVIEENRIVCLSRVGDVGVSSKDLERIIEVDFLFGSRQQQLQRTGRLMHSEEAERHDIIFTEKEIEQYGKRLFALQEKGFTVKVV